MERRRPGIACWMIGVVSAWLLGLATMAPSAAEGPVACLAAAVQGKVARQVGAVRKMLGVLGTVPAGAEVIVPEGGSCTLAFVRGVRVTLRGPCRVRVQAVGVALLEGSESQVRRQAPTERSAIGIPANASLTRIGGRIHRTGSSFLSVDECYVEERPTFTWEASTSRVSFALKQGDEMLHEWREEGKVRSTQVPTGVALERGVMYQVVATAMLEDGRRLSAAVPFRLLTEDQVREVRVAEDLARQESRSNPDDTTPLAILGAVYAHYGLESRLEKLCRQLRIPPPRHGAGGGELQR